MYFKFLNKIFIAPFIFIFSRNYIGRYPAPRNLGYMWNFGILSLVFLFSQLFTGIFLAMFYTPHIEFAFFSLEHVMSNISNGWLIRFLHANGASFFFIFVYVHMLRGIYYNSYQFPRFNLWISGVTIYFFLMGAAFFGYVLPWGQMSFWAVTVITNLLTVFPYVGDEIVYWIWGGYSINNATLNRFFCLHFLLPFIVLVLVFVHLILLHQTSSTNELRIKKSCNIKISFFPYFIIKDLFTIFISFILISLVTFYIPEIFNHCINYVPANPLVTPNHIVPEWYFLPFYAILRSILNKTLGIIVMFLSLAILYLLPILDPGYGVIRIFDKASNAGFWVFVINFICLGFVGSQTAEFPCVELGLICTGIHLSYILIFIPFMSSLEKWMLNIIELQMNSRSINTDFGDQKNSQNL